MDSVPHLPASSGVVSSKVVKVCPSCNQSFSVFPSAALTRVYCSRSCLSVAYSERLKAEANPNYRAASDRVCMMCNRPFSSYQKNRKYCSFECYNVSRAKPKPDPKPRPPKKEKPKKGRKLRPILDFTCVICSKVFTRKAIYNYQVCSRDCWRMLISRKQRGAASHRWQGGKTHAALLSRKSITYKDWRRAVYKRDDFTCKLCGIRGGRLCAHHIKLYSLHPELRYEIANGITLCWRCHASIKSREADYESMFFEITGGV